MQWEDLVKPSLPIDLMTWKFSQNILKCAQWHVPIIPATQKAESRGLQALKPAWPLQQDSVSKQNKNKK
jgi:hypothetical protein